MSIVCKLGLHAYSLTGGVCRDGWVWVSHRCSRCGRFFNPLIEAEVDMHNAKGGREGR
jgi:hypothetical protein